MKQGAWVSLYAFCIEEAAYVLPKLARGLWVVLLKGKEDLGLIVGDLMHCLQKFNHLVNI